MARKEWTLLEIKDLKALKGNEEDCVLSAKAGRKRLCLARHKGELYALDARCPHAGGPLDQGFINENAEIVCPWHRFGFDLKTGDSESGGYFIDSYPIEKRGTEYYVCLPKKRWGLF